MLPFVRRPLLAQMRERQMQCSVLWPRRAFNKSILLTTAISIVLCPSAMAQDAPVDRAEIDEIVVIGAREQGYRATVATQVSRTDTPLQNLPYSVQVVTQDLIRDRGVSTAGEALRYVPGLSPQVGFGGLNDQVSLRGFPVAYNLRNGLRRNYFVEVERLVNVEQVEVLKGPASALYGRFEPGGAVNYVTKKPLDRNFLEVTGVIGEYEQREAKVDANAALGDDLGVRFNGSVGSRDSFRDFVYQDDWFVAPVVRWAPTDRTTLTIEGEYGERDAYFDRGFGNDPFFFNAPAERQFGEPDAFLDNHGGMIAAFLEHKFSDHLSGRAAVGYSQADMDSRYYSYAFPPVVGTDGPDPQVRRRPVLSDDHEENLTTQLELYGNFETGSLSHKILVGAEIDSEEISYVTQAAPVQSISFFNPVYGTPPAGPFVTSYDETIEVDGRAFYLQHEMAFGEFRLLAGLRYDRTKGVSTSRLLADPVAERKEDSLSPRVGLTWTPREDISLYASYARSFRPQLELGRLSNGAPPEPLEAEGFEVGAKFDLLDGRVRPTIAFFDLERRNSAVPELPDYIFVINIGESRSRGVEIDAPVVLSPNWRLIASYTYLDTEITEDTDIPVGAKFFNAPDHAASVWSTYDFGGFLEGLSVGAGAQYVGERAGDVYNTIFIPAYTRVDASLAYSFETSVGSLRAQINVQNLTDKTYYDSGGGYLPLYPGSPRAVWASLSIAFGD